MDDTALSLEEIAGLVAASGEMRFSGSRKAETYAWVEQTLVRLEYASSGRAEKGLIQRYLRRMTGLGRAQITRLIRKYRMTGRVKVCEYQRTKFPKRYTAADVELLAYVDCAHGNLSGPATKRILEREYSEYHQDAYRRVSEISVAQIYRFRNSAAYRKSNTSYQPTKPTVIRIGERRKPRPEGKPGYLRIDTVHQGDQDGCKGIYHINAVDEVTQWEVVAATPYISEAWLIPVLQSMLAQFPFVIRGFHSDNGSEFVNHTVAKLLEKLLVEQTKSRAHRSGDNGLVETKNGSVIRKHIGFAHISTAHAEAVDRFHCQYLNPYLNLHRPCAVPEVVTQPNGKRRRVYKRWATPLELFKQVSDCETYLRAGVTLGQLTDLAAQQSDTEAALEMQRAKSHLMESIANAASGARPLRPR